MNDLYQILGVGKDATQEQIKTAYRKLAATHHPDKPSGDTELFRKIQKAYEVLSNLQSRQRYDETGLSEPDQLSHTEKMVMDLFDELLQGNLDGDVNFVQMATVLLYEKIHSKGVKLANIKNVQARLKRLQGRVQRDHSNLFEKLVSMRLDHCAIEIEKLDTAIQDLESCLNLVKQHSDDYVPPAPANPYSAYLSRIRDLGGFISKV